MATSDILECAEFLPGHRAGNRRNLDGQPVDHQPARAGAGLADAAADSCRDRASALTQLNTEVTALSNAIDALNDPAGP